MQFLAQMCVSKIYTREQTHLIASCGLMEHSISYLLQLGKFDIRAEEQQWCVMNMKVCTMLSFFLGKILGIVIGLEFRFYSCSFLIRKPGIIFFFY